MTTGRSAGRRLLPGTSMKIGYATLVHDLEGTMRTVCEFLGEDFDPAVLALAAFTGRLQAARFWGRSGSASATAVAGEPVNPTKADKWRTGLPDRDRSIIEAATGPGMAAFGYPPAGPARRIGGPERA